MATATLAHPKHGHGVASSSVKRSLTDLAIIDLLWRHGIGPKKTIVDAASIILAESGGRTHAVGHYTQSVKGRGPRTRCTVKGLWQISDCAHPDVSESCAFDADCSTDAAMKIGGYPNVIHGGNMDFSPWATYNNGAYLLYRPRMLLAWERYRLKYPNRGFDPGRAVPENNPLTNAAEVIGGLSLAGLSAPFQWLFKSGVLIRVAEVVGGGVLIVIGVKKLL